MTDIATRMNIHAEVQRAAAKYSQYARVEGPVPPNSYYCPLTYGIPAMGDVIGRLTESPLGIYMPPLRRQVLAVIRKLEREIKVISDYAKWLQDGIDWRLNRGQPLIESYGRALSVGKVFRIDLTDSIEILKNVAQLCPTQKGV